MFLLPPLNPALGPERDGSQPLGAVQLPPGDAPARLVLPGLGTLATLSFRRAPEWLGTGGRNQPFGPAPPSGKKTS